MRPYTTGWYPWCDLTRPEGVDYEKTQFDSLVAIMLSGIESIDFDDVDIREGAEYESWWEVRTDDGIIPYGLTDPSTWKVFRSSQHPEQKNIPWRHVEFSSYVNRDGSDLFQRMIQVKKVRYKPPNFAHIAGVRKIAYAQGQPSTAWEYSSVIVPGDQIELMPAVVFPGGFGHFIKTERTMLDTEVHRESHILQIGMSAP
jgi:hypothetical protein